MLNTIAVSRSHNSKQTKPQLTKDFLALNKTAKTKEEVNITIIVLIYEVGLRERQRGELSVNKNLLV